jgi:GrpB-like predicted nucleotidyltransferase (UPF0157 family)/thymidylate kinase
MKPLVVAIAGVSGAGKSTLARKTAELVGGVFLRCDDYYAPLPGGLDGLGRWLDDGADPNRWQTPGLADDVRALASGQTIVDRKTGQTLASAQVIIVEEFLGRTRSEMAEVIDLVVYVDTPLEVALMRRLQRGMGSSWKAWWSEHGSEAPAVEVAERAKASLDFLQRELDLYDRYFRRLYLLIQPQVRPTSDVVVDGMRPQDELAEALAAMLGRELAKQQSSALHEPRTSRREVVVVPYNPEWPHIFEELKGPVWNAVGRVAVAVEHVGSTAVPGLAAKPIIDMSVVVPKAADVPEAISALGALCYVHRGDLGIPGREAFHSPAEVFPHHLYVCVATSPALANHLAVRDYLRTHTATASEYGALKLRLAEQFRFDPECYGEAKSDLLLGILREVGFESAALAEIESVNRAP